MPRALRGFECLVFPLWRFLKGQQRSVPPKAASAIVVPSVTPCAKATLCLSHGEGAGEKMRVSFLAECSWIQAQETSHGIVSPGWGWAGLARGDLPSWGLWAHPQLQGNSHICLKPHLNQQHILSPFSWNCFTLCGIMRVWRGVGRRAHQCV